MDSGDREAKGALGARSQATGGSDQGLNLLGRVAWDGIQDHLAIFACAGDPAYEQEVENWIRTEAWDWFSSPEDPNDDPRLLILVDEAVWDEPLAVVAHEASESGRFLNAVGVRSDLHRRGIGLTAMATAITDAEQRVMAGAMATWLVHPENLASHGLSEKLGAQCTYPPEDKPFALYALPL